MDVNSLSHSKWNCKYHIVFAPKFRRKVAYGALRQDIANILSMLCKRKGVNIVEAEICTLYCSMQNETKYAISSSLSFISFICSVVLQCVTFEMPQNKDSIKVRIYEVKESLFAAYKNDRIDAFN